MAALGNQRLRPRQNALILYVNVSLCLYYIHSGNALTLRDLKQARGLIENRLEKSLKLYKGMGCEIPKLDPFSTEVTKFDKKRNVINCTGKDWVKCYHSHCRIVDEIKDTVKGITCEFRDIIYLSDKDYVIGSTIFVEQNESYTLFVSDHVKVDCFGATVHGDIVGWSGNTLGLRKVEPKKPPPGRENTFNVLIFGFDSIARNGFIRRMPKSLKVLTEELGATIMEGYNILGDGTPAALFPILTGAAELELPDVRKSKKNNGTLDSFPFIFYKLKQDGYRTAYFEDMPQVGTFQYRFNGWRNQPTDHYLRAFFLEEQDSGLEGAREWERNSTKYCVGDTPQFKLMMNVTEQFMKLDGKRFAFTFIADITHDDFNMVQTADEDTAAFLRAFRVYSEDTLLVVMGDHGPRFAGVRNTVQGKLEERQPLLALRLPSALVRARPAALAALQNNARALSTPHDLHATLLDVLGMTQHGNPYRVPGADLPRGLTMLEPIPLNRSCSEAGIELHWCACVEWQNVSTSDRMYNETAHALLDFINELVSEVGPQCVPRTLISTEWVLRQRPNSRLLAFSAAKDSDGYMGKFNASARVSSQIQMENYQVKIVVGPGRGMFEASMTYKPTIFKEDKFLINARDISRTNEYKHEPDCISATHPHLNKFCYCLQNN